MIYLPTVRHSTAVTHLLRRIAFMLDLNDLTQAISCAYSPACLSHSFFTSRSDLSEKLRKFSYLLITFVLNFPRSDSSTILHRYYYMFKLASLVLSLFIFFLTSYWTSPEILNLVISVSISLYCIWCIWSLRECFRSSPPLPSSIPSISPFKCFKAAVRLPSCICKHRSWLDCERHAFYCISCARCALALFQDPNAIC